MILFLTSIRNKNLEHMKENDPNFTESIFADDAFFEFNEFKNLRKGWYLIIEQFKREI